MNLFEFRGTTEVQILRKEGIIKGNEKQAIPLKPLLMLHS